MTRSLRLVLLALLSPGLAFASDCEHAKPRDLTLDLDGIHQVRFEVNSHDLRLTASSAGAPKLQARACASSAELLDSLVLEQHREGDTLVIRAERDDRSWGLSLGRKYAYLELVAQLPAHLDYDVDVGSGDAWISGVRTVRIDVGSGDAELRDVSGRVDAKVGSGDITIDGVGDLVVRSVGSGDLEAIRITQDVRVGDVGSGDLTLRGVGGSVEIASVGSGDADIEDVSGDLRVVRVGSGDVSTQGVRGRRDLPRQD